MIAHFQLRSRIHFDANILIYLIERSDALQQKVAQALAYFEQTDANLFMSTIGVAECLYGAHKAKSENLVMQYEHIFYEDGLFTLIPIDNESVINAARLGAEKNLKLVDAIHFQAAIELGCELIFTNSRRFQSSHGIKVLQLTEI
jgi:predicted nucleic acid-binding protein